MKFLDNFFKESDIVDTDGETFPDVYSFNFNTAIHNDLKSPPIKIEPPESFSKEFLYYISNMYPTISFDNKRIYLDDIILMVSNIPHISVLDNLTEYIFFTEQDIKNFIQKYSS